MMFALVVAAVLATAHLVMLWKASLERQARWDLYALRDRLRWEAINDKRLLDSPLFTRVDVGLTVLAANLHELSLWPLLPFLHGWKSQRPLDRELEIADMLKQEENAAIAAVARQAAMVFAKHLACRHMFLTCLVIGTVIGGQAAKDFLTLAVQ